MGTFDMDVPQPSVVHNLNRKTIIQARATVWRHRITTGGRVDTADLRDILGALGITEVPEERTSSGSRS